MGADLGGDFLREGVLLLTQMLIELEAEQQIGAARYERSRNHEACRNGHRELIWKIPIHALKQPRSVLLNSPHVGQGTDISLNHPSEVGYPTKSEGGHRHDSVDDSGKPHRPDIRSVHQLRVSSTELLHTLVYHTALLCSPVAKCFHSFSVLTPEEFMHVFGHLLLPGSDLPLSEKLRPFFVQVIETRWLLANKP